MIAMKRKLSVPLLTLYCILLFSTKVIAFDDQLTHPHITERVVKVSNLSNYLKMNQGIQEGYDGFITFTRLDSSGMVINDERKIIDWLTSGSIDEDSPPCRAANHFHNPLKDWNESQMSDDSTGLALEIRNYCINHGWPYGERKSNILWATWLTVNGSAIAENTITNPPSPNTWQKAREHFYKALTEKLDADRQTNLARNSHE